MREPTYSMNLPAEEECPTADGWQEFWTSPPSSLDDPRLADYLALEADWTRPLDWDEAMCEHCLRNFERLRGLVAALERQQPQRPGGER
jgi:hypothetical protein